MKNFIVPRGTADILPAEIPSWRKLEQQAREWMSRYGYEEIITPMFEDRDLFSRSIGQTSDIVQKQMLNVFSGKSEQDPEESKYSLRPEGTASVVRAYIEHQLDKIESLSKLFYFGPMFRGERPQKGRLRQFHQIGVEAIGPKSCSPYLDAEVIALCVNILTGAGVSGFEVKINTLGTPQDKENLSTMLRQQIQGSLSRCCPDCQSRFERNVFRILDCKNNECQAVVKGLRFGYDFLAPESREYFSQLKKILSECGIPAVETPHLVRGLDYYTHTVFEVSCPGLGSQDALGAGGRYDQLVSQLGGPQVDAVGFALGMERVLLAMTPSEAPGPAAALQVFFVALGEQAFGEAFGMLTGLRRQGVSGDIGYQTASLKSQMRLANKKGARYVIILGDDELKRKEVTLKDMQTGEQTTVAADRGQLASLLDRIHHPTTSQK